jgi:hypothetical protein
MTSEIGTLIFFNAMDLNVNKNAEIKYETIINKKDLTLNL